MLKNDKFILNPAMIELIKFNFTVSVLKSSFLLLNLDRESRFGDLGGGLTLDAGCGGPGFDYLFLVLVFAVVLNRRALV